MSNISDIALVLGHAASGKSLWAETEIGRQEGRKIYVATARIMDDEMRGKIMAHAARRGTDWTLIEAPDNLAGPCAAFGRGDTVLIDCATMWLTNRLMDEDAWEPQAEAWIAAMQASPASYVVVTNDVGGGVTPDNAMARRFQQMQGTLNQQLAAAADRVYAVTAGLAQQLK